MSENSRSGVSIPGYQPVEKVGNAPSYGVWIRALQTRMNRKVLLKVLPSGAGKLGEFFAREISHTVRADGRGVLAVIDEGTAGDVRYLVLDEAGGGVVERGQRVSQEHWFEFARRLEGLYRQAESASAVLGPLGPKSLLSLPNGELVIADLGWVIPFGDRLPALDTIPEDLRGAAVAAHNRYFLAASLESVASGLGCAIPKSLRRGVVALTEGEDADQKLPAARVFTARNARSAGVPLLVQILIGACIVAGGAWLASEYIDPGSADRGRDEARDSVGAPDLESNSGIDPSPVTEDPRVARREVEAEANRAFLAAYGLVELSAIEERVSEQVPLGTGTRSSFIKLIESYPKTDAGTIAGLMLRQAWVLSRLRAGLAWEPHRETNAEAMAPGQVTAADRAASDAVRVLAGQDQEPSGAFRGDDWLGWAPLGTEIVYREDRSQDLTRLLQLVQSQLASAESRLGKVDRGRDPRVELEEWQSEIERLGRTHRQELQEEIDRILEERVFQRVLDTIAARKDGLLVHDRPWADSLAARVEAQGIRYNSAKRALYNACRDVFLLCGGGPDNPTAFADWSSARARLEQSRPADEFTGLMGQFDRWSSRLARAEAAANQLSTILEERERAGARESYDTRSETLRGTVRSVVSGGGFVLKVDRRREVRSLRFQDLEVKTVLAIDPSLDRGVWLLVLFFLGDLERSIAGAEGLDSVPEWLKDARTLASERRRKEFENLLERGSSAFAAGDYEEAAVIAAEVVSDFDRSEWSAVRQAKLERWIDARLEQVGPRDAFRNYESLEWDSQTGTLTLLYDFGTDGAKADWTRIRLERTHRFIEEKGHLVIRGSAFLSPDGSTDLFSGSLSVEMQCQPLHDEAPNLNIVIWSGRPTREVAPGLLGGLGSYPLEMARAVFGDGSRGSVILPANVLGRVSDLEHGQRAEHLLAIEDGPKVRRGRTTVSLSDDGVTSTLGQKSASKFAKGGRPSNSWSGSSLPAADRRGTVEIRTYDSAIEIRKIRVQGTLNSDWWDRWRQNKVSAVFK